MYQSEIANFVHAQMQAHYWQDTNVEYEVTVKGLTPLRDSAYTKRKDEDVLDFRLPPPDLNNISRFVFGGFAHCLLDVQKFDSDAERKLAVILECDGVKWFKPTRGQFQIFYRAVGGDREYQPDFVVETDTQILMLEPKAANQMNEPDVIAKGRAARLWCERASAYTARHGSKLWRYALIRHDRIVENTTLAALVAAAAAHEGAATSEDAMAK